MEKFDIVGIDFPCQDFVLNVDHLPTPNQGARVSASSWQGGGKVASGIVSSARQGAKCAIMGAVGDDIFGKFCYEDFKRHGIDVSSLIMRKDRYTQLNIVLSDKATMGRSILGGGRGTTERITFEELDLDKIRNAKYFFVAHLSDVVLQACEVAKEAGVKVFIDADNCKPGGEGLIENLHLIDVFVGSEFVYKNIYGDSTDYEANCKDIMAKGPSIAVFTFGEHGCRGYSEETGYFELPAFDVDATDTLGAGDVYHGGYVAALVDGKNAKEAARYASAVSAIKCTRIGGRSGIPTKEVVEKFLETGEIDYTEIDERVKFYERGIMNV